MPETLHDLIPHRESMLLLSEVGEVANTESSAYIHITRLSSFYVEGKGVPSWIGVEYMGQTAAMIAGYQLQQGTVEPHVGLLLGTRKYSAHCAWFPDKSQLRVHCQEVAVVGDGLATFACSITNRHTGDEYATAKLSVFRKPLTQDTADE